MQQAVIQIQGKQFLVAKDQEILVDKLDKKVGDKFNIPEVLLVTDGTSTQVGQPIVKGAVISVEVIGDEKGDKIRVATYKSKSKYRRVKGHRSQYTRIKITSITVK